MLSRHKLGRQVAVLAVSASVIVASVLIVATLARDSSRAAGSSSPRPASGPAPAGAPGRPSAVQWDRYAVDPDDPNAVLVPYITTVSSPLVQVRVDEGKRTVVLTLLDRRRRAGEASGLAIADGCVRVPLRIALGERAVRVQVSNGRTRAARRIVPEDINRDCQRAPRLRRMPTGPR